MAGYAKFLLGFLFAALPLHAEPPKDTISVSIMGGLMEWNSFTGETPSTKEAAVRSYEEACSKWKVDTRRLMGDKLKFLECGSRHDLKAGAALYAGDGKTLPYLIGNLSYSVGTILVNVPHGNEIAILERPLEGDRETFEVTNFSGMLTAFAKARNSYETNCAKWKAEVEREFDRSLVVASCGSRVDGPTTRLSTNPSESWRSRFHFYSKREIFYFKLKE